MHRVDPNQLPKPNQARKTNPNHHYSDVPLLTTYGGYMLQLLYYTNNNFNNDTRYQELFYNNWCAHEMALALAVTQAQAQTLALTLLLTLTLPLPLSLLPLILTLTLLRWADEMFYKQGLYAGARGR